MKRQCQLVPLTAEVSLWQAPANCLMICIGESCKYSTPGRYSVGCLRVLCSNPVGGIVLLQKNQNGHLRASPDELDKEM